MLDPYRALLERLRGDGRTWAEVAYVEGQHGDGSGYGDTYDKNFPARYGVLLCLQHDWRPSDEGLIRYLFDQEVLSEQREAGDSMSLRLAGYLLARFRRPEDVWRFWEAKRASFDTWCGFDWEFLFAAGATATLQVIQAGKHRQRKALLAEIEERAAPAEEVLARWWEQAARQYPEDEASIKTEELLVRALSLGALEAARAYLDRLADELPGGEQTLRSLRYYHEQCGQHDQALALATARAALIKQDPWDRASALLDVLGCAVKAAAYDEGIAAFDEASVLMQQTSHWKQVGLSRMIVEQGLDLALALPSEAMETSAPLFQRVDALLRQGLRASTLMLEKTLQVAEAIGDQLGARHYRRRLQHARRRDKKMMEG